MTGSSAQASLPKAIGTAKATEAESTIRIERPSIQITPVKATLLLVSRTLIVTILRCSFAFSITPAEARPLSIC